MAREILYLMVVTLSVSACDRIPGTNQYKVAKAQEAVAQNLIDPMSAQFRNSWISGSTVCGEINGKNRMGAYVGFSRFVATGDPNGKWLSQIDPKVDPSEVAEANSFCTSVRSNAYSSGYTVQSACQRATEKQFEQIAQEMFDSSWSIGCEKRI